MASSIIDILVRAKNQASRELDQVTKQLNGLDKATKMAVGGFAALSGAYTLVQAGRFAMDMAQLNTQLERSAFAFEHFSGGAEQAATNLRAVQRASGGMLTDFQAQNLAVTAMTQSLASNSIELQRITKIARGIVAVSPIINDLESAFSQLGLTIANQSMMRLDQLGTSAAELKPKIEALKQANKNLSDEEAFRAALLDTLENKMNSLTGAAINQASGLERLAVAWEGYKNSAAGAFGWVDDMAGGLADALDQQTKFDFGEWLAEQIGNPDFMGKLGYSQKRVVSQIRELTDLSYLDKMRMGDAYSEQIVRLVDEFYRLGDAMVRTKEIAESGAIQGPQLPTFFTGQDWQNQIDADTATAEEAKAAIDKLIEAQAKATQIDVFEQTGNVQQAAAAYEVVTEQLNAWVNKQKRAGVEVGVIMNLLPAAASMFITLGDAASDSADGADKANDAAEKLGTTMSKLDTFVGGAASSLLTFARNAGSAQTASVNLMGAISAAYSAMEKVSEGPIGLGDRQKDRIGNLLPSKELKQVNSELNAIVGGVGRADSAFSDLKSTISGIVSGAIGPVAGVDANDLLPRPDAINENARRLADIAVNGIKGQSWLEEFKNEVPGVWEEIANSDDPKQAAAKILKDFQDGLRPELLDKQTAKDLVKRALQGDANTKQLVDEIAGELASELGISLSDAKAKASEVLGGDMGGGVTGVSLAPSIDSSAAASAASTFASAFTSAIEGGSLGADLSGAIYAQITASVAVIETTGKEAGNTFVKGFTTTFDNIPAAFIAAIAGLVTPVVQANITNSGGRTGAAAT